MQDEDGIKSKNLGTDANDDNGFDGLPKIKGNDAEDKSMDSDEREFIEKISWDTNSDEEDISIDEKIVKFYKKPNYEKPKK